MNHMYIRMAGETDVDAVMPIIEAAKRIFAQTGVDQWQDGYPDGPTLRGDMERKECYVACVGETVIGCGVLSFERETVYECIEGRWETGEDYAVIHRVAVDPDYRGKGVAAALMKEFERLCIGRGVCFLRADTHEDNRPMNALLIKCGFAYRGVVYLRAGEKRLAYDKTIKMEKF